ncbi:hypothetical protein OOT00_04595 [Desulfobotulus sp. H1]|uniref:Uncharacterized protein n=1 Tax=Desulfobotulus pelophilus TaxID=2823377 RepID=A0ABT3N726_9BACT|nr:hypothetical protein [Desulfobotulus pelophilus]MCW7753262.1 hypothetical protein [Desulfobotulus pelophilus]
MIPRLFMLAALVCLILALLTLTPWASASKECLFGYKAYCSFTPGSTFILGMMAYIFHDMARKMKHRQE